MWHKCQCQGSQLQRSTIVYAAGTFWGISPVATADTLTPETGLSLHLGMLCMSSIWDPPLGPEATGVLL